MLSRCRRIRRLDEGFTLVETIVALGIAAGTLLALLGASLFSLQSVVTARQNQQAADVLNESIESARSLTYASLTMRSDDLAGDPAISGGSSPTYDPDGSGPLAAEPVDARPVGSMAPHKVSESTNNGVYTIARYITIPTGAPGVTVTYDDAGTPSIRRFTVQVSWTKNGRLNERRASTFLMNTRRGLPLPYYVWRYQGSNAAVTGGVATLTVNPGNDADFGLELRNQGARDSWQIVAEPAGAWQYYVDTDSDGLWSEDPATEPLLADAKTPVQEAGAPPLRIVAFREVGAAELGTFDTTFYAVSQARTELVGATAAKAEAKQVKTRLVVQSGTVSAPPPPPSTTPSTTSCTPGSNNSLVGSTSPTGATRPTGKYTISQFNLFNGPELGDTPTKAGNTMTRDTSGLQATLCNWSTDQQTAQAGRLLTGSGASPAGLAEWQFQPASNKEDEFGGTAGLILHVQCPSAGAPALTARLGTLNGTVFTQRAVSSPVTVNPCQLSHFERVEVPIPVPAFTVPNGQKLSLRVTSSAPIRIGFGVTPRTSRLEIAHK